MSVADELLNDAMEEILRNKSRRTFKHQLSPDIYLTRLKDHWADFSKEHEFNAGDIVCSKPGFDTLFPLRNGYPALILEIFPPFRLMRNEPGVWDEGMLVDCNLLVIVEDHVVQAAWDLRKLQPYQDDSQLISAVIQAVGQKDAA